MTAHLHSYLGKVARKLVLTRSAEAFALGAVGGGFAAACIMGAWIMAGPYPWWATALALVALGPALPIAGRLWPSRLRAAARLADRWQIPHAICWSMAVAAIVAAVAACLFIHTGQHAHLPHRWIALALIPLGGMLAAMTVLVRGITAHQAALYIDLRANLGERMITALELAPVTDEGFADTVCQHALAAATQHQPHRMGFWRRGRGTAGALALTALATVLLAIVAPLDATERTRRMERQRAYLELAKQLAEQAGLHKRMAEQTASRQLRTEAQRLQQLSEDMRLGRIPPRQAMSELNRLQDEHRAAQARQASLEAAMDRLRASEATEALAPSEDSPTESAEAAAKRFAADAAAKMKSGAMSAGERQQLGEALNDAANAAAGDPRLSAALREAAEMADRNNAEGFGDAMAQAGNAMGDTQSEADAAQARHQAMNDLEQSKNQLAQAGGGGRGLTSDDLRQAMNQAGQRGGEGQGGQGGGEGQGEGQGGAGQGNQGSGKGGGQGGGQQGGTAMGPGGSTNRDAGGGAGGHYEGSVFERGKWAQIYAPKAIEHSGEQISPTGVPNPNAGDPAASAEFLAPGTQGKSYLPFEKAWSAARQRSEDALSRQKIPARLRTVIRDYYADAQ